MLAEKYLADLGITIQQANDFIDTNLGEPKRIFEVASQYGVTTRMLGEITGYSRDIVSRYFEDAGSSSTELDKSILINYDLGTLENLVAFNTREGTLSNEALRGVVKPEINKNYDYDLTFTSPNPPLQLKDGIYSSGELGVEHIDNISPTMGNIESLFYGTLINIFLALDQSEFDQIKAFPGNGNSEEFQTLLLNALNESPAPIAWSDEQLASLVENEAINILDKYWNATLYGVLDHSYLGLATV